MDVTPVPVYDNTVTRVRPQVSSIRSSANSVSRVAVSSTKRGMSSVIDSARETEIAEGVQRTLCSLFYENMGQINNDEVRFYGGIPGGSIGFTDRKVLFWLDGTEGNIALSFENASGVVPRGFGEVCHRTNYFLGDRGNFTGIRGFKGVHYEDLWPGIDLVYRATMYGTKYEFRVRPGADPSDIMIRCVGHDSLAIEKSSVSIQRNDVRLVDAGLMIHQRGERIEGEFLSYAHQIIGFKVVNYDKSQTLVIDPLLYSTFVGGTDYDLGHAIAVDAWGDAYVTGVAHSSGFPTVNAYDSSHNGVYDCFVFKLNATGNGLLYSTFIGGTDGDYGESIVIDNSGNAYVTGMTYSSDFPTVNAYDSSHSGGYDCFVFKLNATGNGLFYSTFVGEDAYGESIAVDNSGNAYVTGMTYSSDFPTVNAFDSSHNGVYDCFVFKLNATGNGLLYSTFMGGTYNDYGYSVAIDTLGNTYVTGNTYSPGFPTVNAYDSSHNGVYDCFVFKLNATGNGLFYSTFIGGTDYEKGVSIAVDVLGNIYVAGYTRSLDFPVVGAYDATHNGGEDCCVFKLNATGRGLVYSTFVGGIEDEVAFSIAIDALGNTYVTGTTYSSDFPTVNAYDSSHGGGLDSVVFKLSSAGSALLYSTFVGGSRDERGFSIAIDRSDNAYVTGGTQSSDFPTLNAYDNSWNTDSDAFVFKMNFTKQMDNTNPDLDSPPDYEYEEGSSGNKITWVVGDTNPRDYRIDGNGSRTDWTAWLNGTISKDVDGHTPGVYNYTITVRDAFGNQAIDTVFVTVIQASGPIIYLTHSPLQPNHMDSVFITATASDPRGVADVTLSYSVTGGSSWMNSTMEPIGQEWSATIPKQLPDALVIYKVYAMDSLGNWAVSVEKSYTVVEATSQIIAERYIRDGETLSGPRSVSFLQHEYDIYEYADQGGSVVGYVIVNMTSLEAVDDQDLAHLVLLQDLFQSNRQDLAVGFPNNAHGSWYSRADFCEDRAETWESVKNWLFWTNFLSLIWDPVGSAINILSTLVSIEEPLAYFNQFGTLVEDISENYSQVYSESPILSTLDLMATTFEAADIYIKLAYGDFLISMGDFANTRHLVTNIKMHLGGMVVGVFTDDHDAMYSDSIISVAAYTVMSKLAVGIGCTYERMLSGPGDLEDYQSLYILQLLYYSAARALAVWKTSLAERYLASSSLSAWIAKALGKISEQDVVKWSLRAASDSNRIREISDQYGVLESLAAERANLLRYEGEEMLIASQEAPSDISPCALTMPPTTGMLLMPTLSASELGGKAKKKFKRKHRMILGILGLFVALTTIVICVVFFASPPVGFQYALPTETPNFSMVQGPISPALTGYEAENLDYVTYGIYRSESGENVTIALVDAKSDSDAAWVITLVAAFAAANNFSVVGSTAGEWETVDLLSQVVSLRVCRSEETVLLIIGESPDTVNQLHNEILSYITRPG